jgi:hypothetical protein
MKQGNHSNAKWALAVAALVVLVSGSMVLGSNMGFKLNMPLPQKTGLAPQGFNIMALPYLVPYADRQCLCDQLGLSGSAVVQEFDASNGTLDFYLCGGAACGAAAALTSGTATFITDTGSSGSAIVVGAHDPAKSIQLECNTSNLPQGDNWVSVPYHSTSASKQALCDEVGPVVTVSEFDGNNGTISTYFCDINPANDTPLTKGRAAKIVLDTGSTECTGAGFAVWVPNHF